MFDVMFAALKAVLDKISGPESEVEKKVKELQALYPEGNVAWEAFLTWWTQNVPHASDIEHDTMVALAREAWTEIASGRPGYNPKHGAIA